MNEPRLFSAEQLASCVRPLPSRPEMFVIIAYDGVRDSWSVAPAGLYKQYRTEQAARDAATLLSGVWTHIDIIRIPGAS